MIRPGQGNSRVLVLTPYLYGRAPGPRSSVELWEGVLRDAGIELEYAPFESERLSDIIYEPGSALPKAAEMVRAYVRQLRRALDIDAYDAVLVYREAALIGPEVIERLVARRKPVIYQLDDPLYVPYRSPFNGYLSYLKFFGKVGRICRLSSVVIVNSPQHREYASRYSSSIWEIPSIVDGDVYRPRHGERSLDQVTLGWSGSKSTAANLRVIADPLREVLASREAALQLIGAETPPIPDVPCSTAPWRAATEVEDLANFDIGLVPLPFNAWNTRKFFLKLVQYMALGIPAVATPLGANPSVIESGVTGFLADTPEDWVSHLTSLIDDRDLRESIGARAAEVAHAHYTLDANAEKIVGAFRAALA